MSINTNRKLRGKTNKHFKISYLNSLTYIFHSTVLSFKSIKKQKIVNVLSPDYCRLL